MLSSGHLHNNDKPPALFIRSECKEAAACHHLHCIMEYLSYPSTKTSEIGTLKQSSLPRCRISLSLLEWDKFYHFWWNGNYVMSLFTTIPRNLKLTS